MKYLLNTIATLLFVSCSASSLMAQQDTIQYVVPGRTNSLEQQHKPYVILISADGFRYDYAKRYQANHLLELSSKGVTAAAMLPSFPSVTFPNHYTLVTGLYPSHHGLVSNTFYDPKRNEKYNMSAKDKVRDGSWYGGTPLWVLAEQQQMLSASMFWVGSEADIKQVRPTYYYNYNDHLPLSQRIKTVQDWLNLPQETRPHLITFYLSETDHAGHSYGPLSKETQQAVKTVDSVVYQLTEAVKSTGLAVNFIFVSDHGMTAVDTAHPLPVPSIIDPEKFRVISSGTMLDIRAKNPLDIPGLYQQLKENAQDFQVYLKTDMPEHFHYGVKDDVYNRIGDILLFSNWPKVFSAKKPGLGYHGFDPQEVKDMQATFMAWGPAFKTGLKIDTFENVQVYPLIAKLLGLSLNEKIDGTLQTLGPVLR
ncbi:alkaline phosphatase family protein [Pedobacter nutrimenti]|uniref:Putative AlkP superfamily pyrophosphatase or phosphodiesterase n=1 Tax=Pedobacter nutrimenti TaxID=1241337 RepID=A0A318ULW7_9SPHI|nr:ectonucleotide pyrophosphatase/phosphodiesterase [Pedobacter nutrimenti]PYF77374.1 putative AlkP superfamily pyrophosphatase or phosphodiesterase [Pedobacter nutrimenti]